MTIFNSDKRLAHPLRKVKIVAVYFTLYNALSSVCIYHSQRRHFVEYVRSMLYREGYESGIRQNNYMGGLTASWP